MGSQGEYPWRLERTLAERSSGGESWEGTGEPHGSSGPGRGARCCSEAEGVWGAFVLGNQEVGESEGQGEVRLAEGRLGGEKAEMRAADAF